MEQMIIIHRDNVHGYKYKLSVTETNINETFIVMHSSKLPEILKKVRMDTNYMYKVPHGNKVRAIILQEGMCRLSIPDLQLIYEITIMRW